ncbi:MAG: hypothetical protein R3A78_06925 [Polyangiales bacterium]
MRLPLRVALASLLLAGCGAAKQERSLPDESSDVELAIRPPAEEKSSFAAEGTTPAGAELAGTVWRWVEGECTEGPLRPNGKPEEVLAVEADGSGLLFVQDRTMERVPACAETIYVRAQPGKAPGEYVLREETRMQASADSACGAPREGDHAAVLRRRGENLEVLMQRAKYWCDGFEARMVYAPATKPVPDDRTLVRHFLGAMARRDANSVASLYAEKGSLVDPYTQTDTGQAARFDGRTMIAAWYTRAFQGTPWVAVQPVATNLGRANGVVFVNWKYMDARLEAPIDVETRLLVATGEIFESESTVAQATAAREEDDKPASR